MKNYKENLTFKLLFKDDIPEISILAKQLNPKLTLDIIKNYLEQMFNYSTYQCFGLFKDKMLIGIASGWITIRLYSGKQLEVDNVVIDHKIQSKGYGNFFLKLLEDWAKQNDCQTVELNTYVENSKSHKFYFNSGYSILGFHFYKKI